MNRQREVREVFMPELESLHPIIQNPILERRIELTKIYCRLHYGFNDYRLNCPRLVVVHYTAFASFAESFDFIRPDEISSIREDIKSGGTVNVGTHYLVDINGEIHQLLPDDVIARHTIGFNYTAISIENVGSNKDELTREQIEADAFLIDKLKREYPSIEYLIGHYEYMDHGLPHFTLLREEAVGYQFTIKQDPGEAFMRTLRERLEAAYALNLKP